MAVTATQVTLALLPIPLNGHAVVVVHTRLLAFLRRLELHLFQLLDVDEAVGVENEGRLKVGLSAI